MVSFNSIWGILFWIVAFICLVWLLHEVLFINKKLSKTGKIIWIIIAIPLSIIGSIIYWIMYKR